MHRREVVWNVEHDIANDTTHGWQRIGCYVFECIFVRRRVVELRSFGVIDVEGYAVPPIDLSCFSMLIKDHCDDDLLAGT